MPSDCITSRVRAVLALIAICLLVACANRVPKEALQLSPDSLAQRQLQTRKFDTKNEKELLIAAASLLQDMGFQIDRSEMKLGVIVGSKSADAKNAGEIASAVMLGILLGANVPWADKQNVRASIVTKPSGKKETSLRVTFQRTIWNSEGKVHKIEGINDPELYQDFFDKLSKAVFLQANQI